MGTYSTGIQHGNVGFAQMAPPSPMMRMSDSSIGDSFGGDATFGYTMSSFDGRSQGYAAPSQMQRKEKKPGLLSGAAGAVRSLFKGSSYDGAGAPDAFPTSDPTGGQTWIGASGTAPGGSWPGFDGDSFINSVYDKVIDRDQPEDGTDKKFNAYIIEKITALDKERDKIDFAKNFEKIDRILSAAEGLADKKGRDAKFAASFKRLLDKLEEKCRINDSDAKLSDIAVMQNFDGSFCHCRALKTKYSLIMLRRLLVEGDAQLYSMQVKKLVAFLGRASLTALEEAELKECLEMAPDLMPIQRT
jgi:hypothetical protein